MTLPRKLGLLMILIAVLAVLGERFGLALPSLRWFFSFDADPDKLKDLPWLENQALIVGYGMCGLIALVGFVMILSGGDFHWNPLTIRKMHRFQSIGRGHTSFRILVFLMILAMLDQVLVGKRALAVRHEGNWCFPAFVADPYAMADFGGDGEDEPNYRQLYLEARGAGRSDEKRESDLMVILPPVRWDPTFDSDQYMEHPLPVIDGVIHRPRGDDPYNGYAYCYRKDKPEVLLRKMRLRDGLPRGSSEVLDENGEVVGREIWEKGVMVESMLPEAFDVPEAGRWVNRQFMPLPPSLDPQHFHLLGTDSKGWDIAAQLYGGLQVVFKGAVLYLVLTYGIGVVMGCLMGYFGGVYDLVMQRVMEIMSNIPFLLVVMIITTSIGRANITLSTILLIFCVFSWISVATYLRTTTYKEKARDYASAARVLGAGTSRVIFRHILPNAISTIITLVPFSVSAVVTGLTALDFLGFGLPDVYPSWGRMLSDGVSNLKAPWIVSSVFAMMVLILLLITFVGEAIREAFDPKKFTTYQ